LVRRGEKRFIPPPFPIFMGTSLRRAVGRYDSRILRLLLKNMLDLKIITLNHKEDIMQTINDILQSVTTLSLDEQCFIAETLNKRISELKREQIVVRAKEAEQNYHTGNTVQGTVSDLMSAISDD